MAHGVASLGEGARAVERITRTLALHIVGGVFGGGVMGALCWVLLAPVRTFIPPSILLGVFLAMAAFALAVDAHLLNRRLPGGQVPATWRTRFGSERSYAMYGLLLGAGLATHVNYATVFVVFAAAGLFLPLGAAVTAGATFGLARAAIVALASLHVSWADGVLYRSRFASQLWPNAAAALTAGVSLAVLAT
jgi:hypothetical protein